MKVKSISKDASKAGVYSVTITVSKPKTPSQLLKIIANPPTHKK